MCPSPLGQRATSGSRFICDICWLDLLQVLGRGPQLQWVQGRSHLVLSRRQHLTYPVMTRVGLSTHNQYFSALWPVRFSALTRTKVEARLGLCHKYRYSEGSLTTWPANKTTIEGFALSTHVPSFRGLVTRLIVPHMNFLLNWLLPLVFFEIKGYLLGTERSPLVLPLRVLRPFAETCLASLRDQTLWVQVSEGWEEICGVTS